MFSLLDTVMRLKYSTQYDANERSIRRKPGLQVTESHVKAKSTFADVVCERLSQSLLY